MKRNYLILTLIATTLTLLLLPAVSSAQSVNESTLEITNLSGTSYRFTYTQFFAMPKTTVNVTFIAMAF